MTATETFEKFDRAALAALQVRELPKLRATDMLTQEDPEKGGDLMAKADEYFSHFAARSGGKCICCGQSLTGIMFFGLGGTFEWGLAHGEGHCSACGYPARAIHQIPDIGRLANFILQYHPSELSFANDRESASPP